MALFVRTILMILLSPPQGLNVTFKTTCSVTKTITLKPFISDVSKHK